MSDVSSYLRYLPPILWRDDPPPESGGLGLGALLRIFEKIATGLPDGDREHPAFTDRIAELHRLFDPWTTPAEFLPWLASWVALDFPTLQGELLWDEYQRRKVTAEIARIYRLRGRRAGLNQNLDLYAVGSTQPRVCVDDGARLVSVVPRPGERAEVTALVSQGPVVIGTQVRAEGLTRPWHVTTGADGSLFVADIGLPDDAGVALPGRVWHLDGSGRYRTAGTPPRPAPLAGATNLKDVVAVAVRPPRDGAPETAYALTRTGRLFSIPAPFDGVAATLVTTLTNPGKPVWMVALTVDPASGELLALDRGGQKPQDAVPSIVTVRPNPVTATRTKLTSVIEPLSLVVEAGGTLLLGDGGPQEPAGPPEMSGNLRRVDRRTNPWTETRLLPVTNALVAPTALAQTRDGTRYVLDAGLKPFEISATNPFICPVAEHAAVFTVDLAANPPELTRITGPGELVYPTGMVATADRLVISDPGQPPLRGLETFWNRARPFHFDVSVHFTESRLPPDGDPARKRELDKAVGNITTIVTEQKPAHTVWTLNTSIL
ncbi:phage tail protein [Actinoplanes sp. NBC_00393]|uniref:phage tail protein n=1 Tax=Actinoplanes sp. NBC_00393 TaxID=2975953 RepID=UPI002E1CC082